MKTNRMRHTLLALCMLLLTAGCSTTKNLPEDETLYTGIKSLKYKTEPTSLKNSDDSTGVILAIAESAEKVNNLLSGNNTSPNSPSLKEDKEADSRYKEDLETAQEQVNAILEYAPNNALFGSAYHRVPPPIGLWAYNKFVNHGGMYNHWMFKHFASEPVLISTVSPDTRVKVATNTLRSYGFFHGNITYQILPEKSNKRKAKISYTVTPGKVFRLDSINYVGFPGRADSLIRHTQNQSYLHKGDAFNTVKLTNEQTRLETLFKNEGYYYYQSNNATYQADTLMKPYKVQLIMTPASTLNQYTYRPWYIGDTYINISKAGRSDMVENTWNMRTLHITYPGKKIPLRPIVWLQNLQHHHGQLYRQSDQEDTQTKLSSLGIFSAFNISYVPCDTTPNCDTLDVYVTATMDKPYLTDFEMNVTEKNADRIGPGVSLNIQRKNAFRGGENLNWKIYGSYEWRTHQDHSVSNDLFNSYEIGSTLSMDFSHILCPWLNRRSFHFPTQTSVSVGVDWLNRAQYFNLFSTNFKIAYSWQKNKTTSHEFVPFSLTYDKLLRSSNTFDSIMTENPALYVSMRDRLVPAMQYTFTYHSASNHRNPVWLQASLKEAGNITSGIYALAGKSLRSADKKILNNPFAQYLKLTAELHNTFKIQGKQYIATRLSAGILYSYGNTTVAPYSDQFFVGGANSIRAFTIRGIGPGHYTTTRSKYTYMDQTGDFKLEANAEYRFPIFGSLNGAVFLDAGNVWLLRGDEQRPGGQLQASTFLKDIALGTGAGLRYDMDFLVLRCDFGIALHNPADTGKSGYYNIPSFGKGFTFHFAIGYPF